MSTATPDYLEAGHLLSAYGERLGWEGDDEGTQKALASAMAIAKHEGDLTLETVTLINAAWVDLYHLRPEENLEKSLRAIELAEQLDDPLPGWNAYLHAARVAYNMADLPSARRYAATFLALCERSGRDGSRFYLTQKLAALAGDWQTARDFFERGLHEGPENALMMLVSVQTLVEYNMGNIKQGEALLGRLVDFFHTVPPEPGWVHLFVPQTIALVARMTNATNHFDAARKGVETVLASQRINPLSTWFARTSLALMAMQQGDTKTVQKQYTTLNSKRGNFNLIDVDRLLGILTTAIGEYDEAATYFEAALAIWRKGRYPEYAWTAYDYADTLLKRGQPGDNSKATTLLDVVLSIADELGMNPLKEWVHLKQASLKS